MAEAGESFTRQIETEYFPNELTGNDWMAKLQLEGDVLFGYGRTERSAIRALFKDLLEQEYD